MRPTYDELAAVLRRLVEWDDAGCDPSRGVIVAARSLIAIIDAEGTPPAEPQTFSLAEVRDGTGWPRGVRFMIAAEPKTEPEGTPAEHTGGPTCCGCGEPFEPGDSDATAFATYCSSECEANR